MNQDRDEAAQEFMDEIVDDLGYTPKGGKTQSSGSTVDPGRFPKFLIPWAIGIFLLVLMIVFFVIGGNGNSTEELASIQADVNKLEERLARLEGLEKLEDRIVHLEKEANRLQQDIRKIIGRDATASPKTSSSAVTQRYHTVRSGESLYTIARKYGISTDRLCKLNNISPKQPIQPGQKLLVGG